MVVSKVSLDIKICPDYSLTPSIEYSPYSTTFFTKSLITYFSPYLIPSHLHFIVSQMLDPQFWSTYFPLRDHLLILILLDV